MKIHALSAILALLAVESCSALAPIIARQATVTVYVLTGYSPTGTPYPNYTVSIPETGVTFPITNPLVVYSIAPIEEFSNPPQPYYPQANCTFTLEDGTKAYVTGTQDITPQRVTSVSCVAAQYPGINTSVVSSGTYPSPTAPSGTSAGTALPTIGTISRLVPPYPTGTGYYYVYGTTGASGSAVPPRNTGVARRGNGKNVARFTGDAGRVTGSFGVSLIPLLGFVLACGWFPLTRFVW